MRVLVLLLLVVIGLLITVAEPLGPQVELATPVTVVRRPSVSQSARRASRSLSMRMHRCGLMPRTS